MISIIIPVYNSEKYLRHCCDSILRQDYKNYEVLLINDGSTDNSGDICEYYTTIDERFKVFHKYNSGVSSARNLGIKESKGDFITFVDSDDYLAPDYLCQLIINSSYDLVVGGCTNVNEKNEISSQSNNILIEIEKDNFVDMFNVIDKSLILDAPWNKLFHSSIIKQYDLRFSTELNYGEDKLFTLNYIQYCNSIIQLNNNSYYYRNYPNNKYILSSDYRLKWINMIEKSYREIYKKYNISYPYINCDSFKCFLIHNLSLYVFSLFTEGKHKDLINKKLYDVFNFIYMYNISLNNCNSQKTKLLFYLYKYRLILNPYWVIYTICNILKLIK